jgi:signal peptidase I
VTSAPSTASSGGRRLGGCLFELVETLVLTVLIFFGIQTFVAQPYQVRQQSMEQTLAPGEYVLVDKLSSRWNDYERGDIVVFRPPDTVGSEDQTPFIKRLIGLPGDVVEIRDDGLVYVNEQRLSEDYLFGAPPTEPGPGGTNWVVPEGSYFVMGDHRNASSDSRTFGTVERDRIVGRAFLRYWPLDRFGLLPDATPYPTAS